MSALEKRLCKGRRVHGCVRVVWHIAWALIASSSSVAKERREERTFVGLLEAFGLGLGCHPVPFERRKAKVRERCGSPAQWVKI